MSGSVLLFSVMSSRIFLVSLMGTFEYMLVMSSEANVVVGVIGVCNSWLIRSVELDSLNAYGRGVSWVIFLTEGFSKFVGRGVAPVDNGTDGVVWFV